MTDLQILAITDLVPHPDNPRLQMREDVVERIAAEIGRDGFGEEHALLVWVTYPAEPGGARTASVSERYTIVSGHHRAEAASRAGLAEVPCWVKNDLGETRRSCSWSSRTLRASCLRWKSACTP